ncbi:MAG: GNAT family N-acetyltransferase [Mycobacterium sp.]|nr:GNAT family N-acetyltransferase [Mycobacterium sp.]
MSAWSRDEDFCRANGWPSDLTPIRLERWLQQSSHVGSNDLIRFGVELAAELVGYVDLANLTDQSAEFGIAIGDSQRWGQGVGTAAGEALLAHAFDDLRLRRVAASTTVTNTRSRRLLSRLGFLRRAEADTGFELAFELEQARWRSLM